jgi:endonuclease YncB( thermonuclease family)
MEKIVRCVEVSNTRPPAKTMKAYVFALTLVVTPANAEPILSNQIVVLDGDTVRIRSQSTRLVGFNAPETRHAACPAEWLQGDAATRRLRELVRGGDLDFTFVKCSCPTGTQGTTMCNYGRACGVLKVGGRDVGEILISEGLAVPFVCGATRRPPTPRPWCR